MNILLSKSDKGIGICDRQRLEGERYEGRGLIRLMEMEKR